MTAAATDGRPVGAEPGDPLALGLTEMDGRANLAVFSRHATAMTLLLFAPDGAPVATLPLDPARHRTGDVWHARLSGSLSGLAYGLRADGPFDPAQGHRFDAARVLLDPYAAAVRPGGGEGAPVLGVVEDHRFDWADDRPPRHPWSGTVIYEAHVRGLTAHPSSGVRHPGTYLGLVERIPYLRALGVTAVELMPVQEFPDWEGRRGGGRVRNYWGYSPVALFAPKAGYATDPGRCLSEFRTMVRELHRAGIEVILDVVFNHTAEGDETGPTLSFRGLDNSIYYILAADRSRYADFTGCGNTLNCNHPVVRGMIVDCLRHWVAHFHVDGFRFDLASILGRDQDGNVLSDPPLLRAIAEDPVLRDVKLIAEAWDAGGAFQVGNFPGGRWAEWNCHFRDDVRRFWRGDPGLTGAFASRLAGSADVYQHHARTPLNSVNFVTSHDGFTLADLVSFARKHNEANGEDNRDGRAEELGENNGLEGPTDDPAIEAMRLRQIRNFLVTLLVSRGVPMILGGDEFRRTQRGNSNAWCQDNETSWHDWRLAERNADLVRFTSRLIAFRKAHPVLAAERFYTEAEIAWLGPDGGAPDWHGPENRLGCVIAEGPSSRLALLFNAGLRPCRFRLPPSPAGRWAAVIDTAAPPPRDIAEPDGALFLPVEDGAELGPRSTLVLVSSRDGPATS